MAIKEYKINSEKELLQIAEYIASQLKKGDVVTLEGGLGAGKTTFTRYLIKYLAGEEVDVPSPTFTLVQEYQLDSLDIWHFDLYRLEEKEIDILELGWEEARRYGVAIVEWADRLGGLLPQNHINIEFSFIEGVQDSRVVRVSDFR